MDSTDTTSGSALRTRTSRVVLAGAALLLGVAAGAWGLWPRTAGPVTVEPTAAEAPPAAAPPGLAASPASEARPPSGGRGARTEESAVAPAVVAGRVLTADGKPVAAGRVVAVARDAQAATGQRFEADVGADGAWSIEIPLAADAPPVALALFALVPGFARQETNASVSPGGRETADLVLRDGLSTSGVVVDPAGKPVPHLPLTFRMGGDAPDAIDWYPGPEEEFAQFDRWTRAVATTDDTGRFEIAALPPGGYGVATPSAEWFIRVEDPLQAGARDARLVAVPGIALLFTVVDAATRAPLAPFDYRIAYEIEPKKWRSWSGSGFSRPIRFAARRIDGVPEPVVRVTVRVDGHRTEEATYRFAAGVSSRTETIALAALAPHQMGKVVLTLPLPAQDLPIEVTRTYWVDSNGFGALLPVTPEGAGRWSARLAPGPWGIEVRAKGAFGELVAWEARAELKAGEETDLRVEFPPLGRLRLLLPEGASPRVDATVLINRPNTRVSGSATTGSTMLEAVLPAGEWQVALPVLREFTIVEGQTTTVELTSR